MFTTTLLATVGLYSLACAQKLTKPPLENGLDYLKKGLMDNLHSVHSTNNQWKGWIPTDCESMAKSSNLNPADVTTYNVTYDDVSFWSLLSTYSQQRRPRENELTIVVV